MFGGREQNALTHEACCVANPRYVSDMRLNLEVVEVNATKDNSCVSRGRQQTNYAWHGGMQADAGSLDGTLDCKLVGHLIMQSKRCTSATIPCNDFAIVISRLRRCESEK